MPADMDSLYRSLLPNNNKVATVLIKVSRSSFNARFLPKNLVRMMVNRSLEEIRKSGHEVIGEKGFEEALEHHARTLIGRFRAEISQLNNRGR
jgi:hypothetical protein